jgi:hypothetical protein
MPRNNLWKRLGDLKVPFGLRASTIRLYEKIIAKFNNSDGWLEEINCNIGVKKGFPLSPTRFAIKINKLEVSLKEEGVGTNLVGIAPRSFFFTQMILFFLARSPCDLDKKLRILKKNCVIFRMSVNAYKTKVMIIKSRWTTYLDFLYETNITGKVLSYKYHSIDNHNKINWNYSVERRINGGWKSYFGPENNCNETFFHL